MADTGIDFGQSSQEKYSLRGFLNKQETPMPIAQDVAQAIQVADNAFKSYEAIDDKSNQARYFNAITDFNNLRTQQQDELGTVGNDLNATRQVLDKYRPQLEGLATKYQLNEKYTSDIGSKVEGHNSGWEEHYRGKYNAQQEGIADTNIAEVIKSMQTIGVNKDDVHNTLLGLKEYRKQMTGSMDERVTSVKIAEMFGNARMVSLDKDTLTFKEANAVNDETLAIMEKFDSKITTTAEYRKIKDAFDFVKEKKRTEEEKTFDKYLKEARVPPKEAAKAIATKVAEGIVKPEQAEVMRLTAENNYIDAMASIRSREYTASNREISLASNGLAYNNATPEEQEKKLLALAEKNGWDKRQVMDEIVRYRKPYEAAIMKAAVDKSKEKVGYLLEEKTIVHGGKEVTPTEFKDEVITSSNGTFGQEQQNKVNAYDVMYRMQKNPEIAARMDKGEWGVHADDASKNAPVIAKNRLYSGDIEGVASMAKSYGGESLKLGESFNRGFLSKDQATFNGTMQAYTALKQALPNSYTDVVGKELAIEMGIMSDMLAKSGKQIPDERLWSDVEQAVKTPINLHDRTYTAPLESLNTFMTKKGITNRHEMVERFNGRIKMGGNASDVVSEITDSWNKLDVGNPNVDVFSYGKDIDNFTKKTLDNGAKYISEISAGAVTGYTYNSGTKTMWFSTPTNKFAYRTNESLEDFTKNLAGNMAIAKNKKDNILDVAYNESMAVNSPESLALPDSGSGKAIKDIFLKTPTTADKRRLKQIVTGE